MSHAHANNQPCTRRCLFEIVGDLDEEATVLRCPEDQVSMRLSLWLWRVCGLQSVRIPHTYAAALMATDLGEAIDAVRMPWPAFEIQVPSGLLLSSHGAEVHSVIVATADRACMVGTHDDGGYCNYRTHDSLARVVDFGDNMSDPPQIDEHYSAERERRSWQLVQRLVAGVCLAIAAEREKRPGAYSAKHYREKRGMPRPNEFVVGTPLKLDCREAIRDFIEGRRSSSPTVTTLVRGHWRHQPHGPNREQRRLQWIQPFFRGEGPLLVRPTHIGGAS